MRQAVITGNRISLRHLEMSDASDKYLGWLNDEEVSYFTSRRGVDHTMGDVKTFLSKIDIDGCPDWHMSVRLNSDNTHIGNIAIADIDEQNNSGELGIMMGDREYWNQGYGLEAVNLATEFAFHGLELHRLSAESPNPAFNKIMVKAKWYPEGTRKDAFLAKDTYHDAICWAMLKSEWIELKSGLTSVALEL